MKICGLTRPEDAEAAVACGANALGFVFWPGSPRQIRPDRARAIVSALPPFVTAVGVFVNQEPEYINRIAAEVPLGVIQLHGDETPEYAKAMARPVLKAIALASSTDDAIDAWPWATMILLDAHDPVRRGGTGRAVDWSRASTITPRRRVVLAGGLNSGNVAAAIMSVRPFGIDVSSGVEAAPGVKDPEKLVALFKAVSETESPRRTQWTPG